MVHVFVIEIGWAMIVRLVVRDRVFYLINVIHVVMDVKDPQILTVSIVLLMLQKIHKVHAYVIRDGQVKIVVYTSPVILNAKAA